MGKYRNRQKKKKLGGGFDEKEWLGSKRWWRWGLGPPPDVRQPLTEGGKPGRGSQGGKKERSSPKLKGEHQEKKKSRHKGTILCYRGGHIYLGPGGGAIFPELNVPRGEPQNLGGDVSISTKGNP